MTATASSSTTSTRSRRNADRSNLIDPSFTGGAGIFNVQQNNGNANVMAVANAVVGVVAISGNIEDLTQTARAGGEILEVDVTVNGGTFDNTIDSSFDDATGWMNVQQNNGDANAITQATAVAGTSGSIAGPGSNDLSQTAEFAGAIVEEPGADPSVDTADFGSDRDNLINNSFDNASGLVNVQQNNGNANTIGVANAVAGVDDFLVNDLDQDVDVSGSIDSDGFIIDLVVDVVEENSQRTNEIDDSFNGSGFNGVATVQQNNGDGNVIGAATAVIGEAPIFGEPSGRTT